MCHSDEMSIDDDDNDEDDDGGNIIRAGGIVAPNQFHTDFKQEDDTS